jgi:hypothetical protein
MATTAFETIWGTPAPSGPGGGFIGEAKDQLRREVEQMKSGKLGLSEQEKAQMVGDATTQANASGAQAATAATRTAIAGGGGYEAGLADQLKAQQEASMGAGAQASLAADQASRQQASAKYSEILARLARQQDRARENAQQAAQMTTNVAAGALGASENSVLGSLVGA